MIAILRADPEGNRFSQQSTALNPPFTLDQAKIARQAYRDFGKGNHPAALNFGDCFSYALAKTLGQPLLYKGRDFAQTDVASPIS